MTFWIVAAAAVAGLAGLLVRMSREVEPPPPPMPEPADRTLADWRRDFYHADDPDRTWWADCACCGAPSYDRDAGCDVCGWVEGEGEPLEQARANSARHGMVNSPEDMAEWGEIPPSDEERAIVNQIMELCDAAPVGRQPGAEYWERFQSLTWALEAERDRRLQAAQDASADQAG